MWREVVDELEETYDDIIKDLKRSLSKLRTGRANLSMLDDIHVPYYGSAVPLEQVANLRIADPRLITIQPWEKEMIPKIEKAVRKSDLGLNPTSDSEMVRVPIPALSGERREELSRVASNDGEEHKIVLRNKRREANETIEELEDESEISEDDMHRAYDKIDAMTKEYQNKIDQIVEDKIEEIKEV